MAIPITKQTGPTVASLDVPVDGMTLRDWLAGQALAGFTRERGSGLFNEHTARWYARVSYELADAMLEERAHDPATRPSMQRPNLTAQNGWRTAQVAGQ